MIGAVEISLYCGKRFRKASADLREARGVRPDLIEPVLVTDLNVVQRERRWVAILRPLRAPLCLSVAGNVLHLVHRILHVRFKVFPRSRAPAQRVACIHRQYRLDLQVLAPLQKLQQSEAIA